MTNGWLRTATCKRMLLVLVLWSLVGGDGRAAEYGPWRWTSDLPSQATTPQASTNRTRKAVDTLFRTPNPPILLADLLTRFGSADAFSRQGMHSRNKGTAENAPEGGTLRFVLQDGEELHVWTGDLVHVHLAMLWSRNGNSTLVFK